MTTGSEIFARGLDRYPDLQDIVLGGQILEARCPECGSADREQQPHPRRLRVHLEAGVVHTCELTVSVLTLADDGRGQVQTDAHRNNNSAAAGPGLASTELGPGSFADCVYVNIWMSYCNTALKCCILDILCKAGIRFQVQCVHTTPGLIAALLRSCH